MDKAFLPPQLNAYIHHKSGFRLTGNSSWKTEGQSSVFRTSWLQEIAQS
jgi:hypothetical protein